MKLKELIEILSQFPEDIALDDIDVFVNIDKMIDRNRIISVYIADHRVVGQKQFVPTITMKRITRLSEIAASLVTGLRLRKFNSLKRKQ